MWNMHGTCSCNRGLQAQLLCFFFFLRFYCFSKDIGFHKKTRTKPRENKKSPFHTIARTKADKKSCSDSLECEYHLNKLKVGKV